MALKDQLEHIFSNDYPGTKAFVDEIIKPIFGDDITPVDTDLAERSEYTDRAKKAGIKHIHYIGNLTEQNYNADNIVLLDVTVDDSKNIERSRVNIQQFIRSIAQQHQHLLIVFHYENVVGTPWRFSYAYKAGSIANTTSAKRYTYVFGQGFRGRTAAERFAVLAASPRRNQDFIDAFSVEALSNDFFDGYRELYADFVQFITGKRYEKVKGKYEEVSKHAPDPQFESTFDSNAKQVRDYVKKMFGRIVFLYFLQRKGWLYDNNGVANPHYMHDLFANSECKDNFLDGCLEHLFFYVLNTDKEQRTDEAYALLGGSMIPYLNGGLFERDDIDPLTCVFPADYFKRLFDFLDRYNFTIDENDAEDAEIGIDPEMLGRIFENLLEDNKDKGAFYTPKEIVDYMCRESIIAYLQNEASTEDGRELIRRYIETLDIDILNEKQRAFLEKKLLDVKICDPAIGSGAFPMGLVNLLSKIFISLRTYSTIDQAKMKRHIMQNSIYGVDIEKGAVDIARLRFWLAMVVDEDTPMPLPNLHFKIMQGNSLLETYKGLDLKTLIERDPSRIDFITDAERQQLQTDLRFFYAESDHSKRAQLMTRIKHTVMRMINNADSEIRFDGLDVSSNNEFFLWHTWFSDVFANGGFDIVIGNPPYGATLSEPDKTLYRNLYPETEFKIDTYSLFVLQSFNLLKEQGIMYYIIPNTLLDNYFEEGVRKRLLEHNIIEINDLSDKIFLDAVVHSMIFGYRKRKMTNAYQIKCDIGEGLNNDVFFVDSSFFENQQKTLFSIRSWETRKIYEKLALNSVNLKDVLNIRQAIKSGDDKRYISTNAETPEYKPILRGKDIQRFKVTEPGLFLHYGDFLACPRTPDIFEQPKILIREAGARITAAIDYNNNYIMSSLYNCIIIDRSFSIEYLLGLINSALFQHLMNKLTFEKTKGAFTKAKIYHYYELPVRKASQDVQFKIASVVLELMDNSTSSELESKLNKMIYHLYELTYDEVLAVEPETPITRKEYENFNIEPDGKS